MSSPPHVHPGALARVEALRLQVLDRKLGLVRCPGQHLHTTANGVRDCKVYGGPEAPFIYCFHSSCRRERAQVNHILTKQPTVCGPEPLPRGTPSQLRAAHREPNDKRIADLVARMPWPYQAIRKESPRPLGGVSPHEQAAMLLELFGDNDIVWIGRSVRETGKPEHRSRFRSVVRWRSLPRAPGMFICPSTFAPQAFSRTNECVTGRPYLVVESDKLDRDQVGSVFKWMIHQGYTLRAVVDTAGRSLHGWWDYPPTDHLESLVRNLTELGCDPAMFKASQPCRLPGAVRDGQFQKLIYFNPKANP